ncbi:MAG: cysteine hydrolase family protein, partial [Alphaproteobacteria bacterium]
LAARIGKLVEAARDIGVMVVWIKAIYDHDLLPAPMLTKMLAKGKGAVCCASGSWGADFYEIGPVDGEQVVEKRCYSAFHNTQMDDILRRRGIKSLVMTGVATNVCVESTLREAFFHGYYIVMPPDCVGSANAYLHEASIKTVEQIFGYVPESDEVLGIWAGNAGAAAAAAE